MLIASFPAGPLQTNCYVIARAAGEECVIIDPGMQATDLVSQIVTEQDLRPVAILLTHGHIDHVFSVRELTKRFDIPAYIHDADRSMLSLDFDSLQMAELAVICHHLSGGADALIEPADTRSLPGAGTLTLAGMEFHLAHAPGHTPGGTLITIPYAVPDSAIDRVVFTGDVVFAGSIGRTDLPGGDHPTMLRTLTDVVLTLPDTAALLAGHGGQTTMAHERATNPYLQENML